jgi:predicted TIM-barrel fold metal-dependent hydrolase
MYKIIDGHVHLFPDRLMRAIITWFERFGCEMPFNWSYEKYLEYLRGIGVSELMVLGYAHKAGMSKGINEWLADLSDKHPEVKPYACVHQDDINKTDMMKEFIDGHGFYGVKIHSFVQQVSANDKRFTEVLRFLSERGKGLVLHASSMPVNSPYTIPNEVEFLLREYTDLRIMVAHLGLREYHYDYLRLLDKYENLYLDTAMVFGNINPELIYSFHNNESSFLEETTKNYSDRIIYGSDFPVVNYPPEDGIEHIRSLNLGAVREEQIFYANAKRFMGK